MASSKLFDSMAVAFVLGFLATFVVALLFVSVTYRCQSGPCDAGGMSVFSATLGFGPIVGGLAAGFVYRRHRRRGDGA